MARKDFLNEFYNTQNEESESFLSILTSNLIFKGQDDRLNINRIIFVAHKLRRANQGIKF